MILTQLAIDWLHLFVLTIAIGLLLHEAGLISLGHAGMLLGGAYAFGLAAMGTASFAAAGAAVVAAALSTNVLVPLPPSIEVSVPR